MAVVPLTIFFWSLSAMIPGEFYNLGESREYMAIPGILFQTSRSPAFFLACRYGVLWLDESPSLHSLDEDTYEVPFQDSMDEEDFLPLKGGANFEIVRTFPALLSLRCLCYKVVRIGRIPPFASSSVVDALSQDPSSSPAFRRSFVASVCSTSVGYTSHASQLLPTSSKL
eukprot:1385581-Amorphochlora_amoeboformis.AAC.1